MGYLCMQIMKVRKVEMELKKKEGKKGGGGGETEEEDRKRRGSVMD